MSYKKLIIPTLVSSNLLLLGICLFLLVFSVGNSLGDTSHYARHQEEKYELLINYVFKQNSHLSMQEFMDKHGIEGFEEGDFIIIDGVYFYFTDSRLSSIE